MIAFKTFGDIHMVNTGARGLAKREKLREEALAFIAERLEDRDVLCITESSDEYASSVTVWYRE